MFRRIIAGKLRSLAKRFPVVSLTGPRQSGKTTLTRLVFANYDYVSLENPDEMEFALSDPIGFLTRFKKGVILDEIQRAPVLLSYIQGIVDQEHRNGRFILTGSQQFHLLANVSQTLAGRSAILNLLPLSLRELLESRETNPWRIAATPGKLTGPQFELENVLFSGFYPRIHDQNIPPHDWYSAYYRTYVERDVREVTKIGAVHSFQNFVRLCAGRSGQLLNHSSLASDCGISHTTASHWISVLESSFLIYLLQPHFRNFSKRIIKSPKLHFLDTGLLCFLLRIRSPEELMNHSMRGAIFESYVLSELYKAFANRGETPPLYFWRDKTGHELDFLMETGKELIPIEAKSARTISSSSSSGLEYYKSLASSAAGRGVLIHAGDSCYVRSGILVRPWFRCY